jgi:hypothetical protein
LDNQAIRRATIVTLACAGVAFLAAARPALAQEQPADGSSAPVELVNPGAVPFSSAELTQALQARSFSSEAAAPPRVQIAPAGDGAVAVEVGERSRVVALADRTGPAAARVVALVIAELMTDAEAEQPSADDGAAAPVVTVAPVSNAAPAASLAAASAAGPTQPGPPPRLSLTGGVARGLGNEELLAGALDADLALSVWREGFRLMPSAGLVYMPTRYSGTWREVSFSAAVARVLAGGSVGPVDLMGGPFVSRYSIDGATAHAGFLFGAEALARLAAPLSRHTRLIVAMRVNVYGNRVRVLWPDGAGDAAGYATPRVELTIGVGLAWDWTS